MRTANPALSESVFRGDAYADRFQIETTADNVMTINGTVVKTAVLLLILTWTAAFSWSQLADGRDTAIPLALGGAVVGLILALITIFKPQVSPYTSPLYAAAEGLFLGTLSAIFEAQYSGIVVQAIGLTFGTLGALLLAYRSGLIKATENFKLGVVAATGGIALLYLVSMVMRMFGYEIPLIHESGLVGIGFSAFVVVIAALNLVLDFDFIESGAQQRAPKYMEWYGAFGLLVTLVWLYIEILRLLAKLNSRD